MTAKSLSSETQTRRRAQTTNGRAALARTFSTPEQKRAFYTALGKKSAQGRVVLRLDEAEALSQAYALLGRIAERAQARLANAPTTETESDG